MSRLENQIFCEPLIASKGTKLTEGDDPNCPHPSHTHGASGPYNMSNNTLGI